MGTPFDNKGGQSEGETRAGLWRYISPQEFTDLQGWKVEYLLQEATPNFPSVYFKFLQICELDGRTFGLRRIVLDTDIGRWEVAANLDNKLADSAPLSLVFLQCRSNLLPVAVKVDDDPPPKVREGEFVEQSACKTDRCESECLLTRQRLQVVKKVNGEDPSLRG